MTVFRRPGIAFWYYEFVVEGKRYRGSTKTVDKRRAEGFEAARRLEVAEASQRLHEEAIAPVQSRPLWDVAQSWLALSEKTLADHQGNLGRVRKLFGREMRLIGGKWDEADSGRFGLPRTTLVRDVTPRVLEALSSARRSEGSNPATIEREMALVQSILAHVGVRLAYRPTKSARDRVNKAVALPAQPLPAKVLGCGFSASQYGAAEALRHRLEKSLQTPVTLRIAVGEPYRIAGADEAGGGSASEPGDFMRDQRLRMTLWADAPRPAEETRWPLVSLPADVPDFDSLVDAAWTEASYVWEALSKPAAAPSRPSVDGHSRTVLAVSATPSRLVQMMQARAARRREHASR